jgi:hypothetical protein
MARIGFIGLGNMGQPMAADNAFGKAGTLTFRAGAGGERSRRLSQLATRCWTEHGARAHERFRSRSTGFDAPHFDDALLKLSAIMRLRAVSRPIRPAGPRNTMTNGNQTEEINVPIETWL